MKSISILIAAVLGALCAGLLIGYSTGGVAAKRACQAEFATRATAVVQAQNQRIQEANALGDSLTRRLQVAEAVIHKTQQERDHALKSLTSGRACLSAGAVSLLNDPQRDTSTMPQTTGQPDATHGAIASDTDVASWISNTKSQYDTCRSRLGGLIDWWEIPAHD